MQLKKPPAVSSDTFKSAKWDEITSGQKFNQSDAPILALLCQWYKVVEQAIDELDEFEQTAYTNKVGDLSAFPQITTLKTASAEIRQLNKQLGIDTHEGGEDVTHKDSVLARIQGRRTRKAKAAN